MKAGSTGGGLASSVGIMGWSHRCEAAACLLCVCLCVFVCVCPGCVCMCVPVCVFTCVSWVWLGRTLWVIQRLCPVTTSIAWIDTARHKHMGISPVLESDHDHGHCERRRMA